MLEIGKRYYTKEGNLAYDIEAKGNNGFYDYYLGTDYNGNITVFNWRGHALDGSGKVLVVKEEVMIITTIEALHHLLKGGSVMCYVDDCYQVFSVIEHFLTKLSEIPPDTKWHLFGGKDE